jgi:23S rRNA (uracil1939-C5)-methyltransferase
VRLDVQVVDSDEGDRLQVLVRPTDVVKQPVIPEIGALTAALAKLPGVGSIARQHVGGTLETICGSLFGTVTLEGRAFSTATGSFFQSNVRLLPQLIARQRQAAAPMAGKRIADVYGGVGVFGLSLAAEAQQVTIVRCDTRTMEVGKCTTEQ